MALELGPRVGDERRPRIETVRNLATVEQRKARAEATMGPDVVTTIRPRTRTVAELRAERGALQRKHGRRRSLAEFQAIAAEYAARAPK
jgi:hypothetical protein